jgi:hypothetical protein
MTIFYCVMTLGVVPHALPADFARIYFIICETSPSYSRLVAREPEKNLAPTGIRTPILGQSSP